MALFAEGATVPFVARYRKERTGGLDEVALLGISERATALEALEKRRTTVLDSIREQGKLDAALERAILAVRTRAELEDLYLPYKPKRRTRAAMAIEAGLEPLAERIAAQPRDGDPLREAAAFVGDAFPDAESALRGARDILAERIVEAASLRQQLREAFARYGVLESRAIKKATAGVRTKFEDYYEHSEPIRSIPSHRELAIARGESEGVLRVRLAVDDERHAETVVRAAGVRRGSPWAGQLEEAARDGYTRLLAPSLANEVRAAARERSEEAAIDVFATNLEAILLAPPLGSQPVVGIDPGFRTGCKVVALDAGGRFVAKTTLFPHENARRHDAGKELAAFLKRHGAFAVAVGNGTAGRETEAFVNEVRREDPALASVVVVSVNEAGASVYSASEIARAEFPDLDLTFRGAISIGRRLQDPLAELVKVEPRAIGVGQYQHDVDPKRLGERLGRVVERCVNRVGVDLNTASAPLLTYVSGVGEKLAQAIVAHREARGLFRSRAELSAVKGLGPKRFEQAAGFLRVRGDNPLDASAVHPERYGVVERMAASQGVPVSALVGDAEKIARIDLRAFVGGDVGMETLRDIVAELEKPGRDPRDRWDPVRFRDDVRELEDLREGMVLEGVVTNVTAFGAFVDIGVHQDGLVHISKLAKRFVRDPHQVVAAGQRLSVKVLGVDLQRRRISLENVT